MKWRPRVRWIASSVSLAMTVPVSDSIRPLSFRSQPRSRARVVSLACWASEPVKYRRVAPKSLMPIVSANGSASAIETCPVSFTSPPSSVLVSRGYEHFQLFGPTENQV